MRIKVRQAALVGLIAIIASILFIPLGPYRERSTYRCDDCFARKDVARWWVGSWAAFAIPVSPRTVSLSELRFAKDFLPEHKEHHWTFAQSSPYYWGRWGGCAIGSGRHTSTAFKLYEQFPEFAPFLEKKIAAGDLTREKIVAIISERAHSTNELASKGDELVDEFYDSLSR